jgi:hypothetical protein
MATVEQRDHEHERRNKALPETKPETRDHVVFARGPFGGVRSRSTSNQHVHEEDKHKQDQTGFHRTSSVAYAYEARASKVSGFLVPVPDKILIEQVSLLRVQMSERRPQSDRSEPIREWRGLGFSRSALLGKGTRRVLRAQGLGRALGIVRW